MRQQILSQQHSCSCGWAGRRHLEHTLTQSPVSAVQSSRRVCFAVLTMLAEPLGSPQPRCCSSTGHTPLQREAQMQPGTIWQQPPASAPCPAHGISPSLVSFRHQAPGMGVCRSGILTRGAPAPGGCVCWARSSCSPRSSASHGRTLRHGNTTICNPAGLPGNTSASQGAGSHTQPAVPRHALAAWPSAVPGRALSLPDTSHPPRAPNKAMAQPG